MASSLRNFGGSCTHLPEGRVSLQPTGIKLRALSLTLQCERQTAFHHTSVVGRHALVVTSIFVLENRTQIVNTRVTRVSLRSAPPVSEFSATQHSMHWI